MKDAIKRYIEEHRDTWSPSTARSEEARLLSIADVLTGDPAVLWKRLQEHYKPYSRVTYWTRAAQFWGWLKPTEPNPYTAWRKKKLGRTFAVAYTRRVPTMTYEEARAAILGMECPDVKVRNKCLELLDSGMRWTESHTLRNGQVTGKGGKVRRVYADIQKAAPASSWKVRQALSRLGLTPHALRKIWAMEMVRRGANAHQLLKLGGWTNLNTTQSYVEADDQSLENLVKGE